MGKVILWVEDDEDVLVALKQRLEQEGYRVDTARDGREALSLLAGNRRYDAIVSGLNMPVMNGLELLKSARHDDRDVPFILISGGASEERIAEALRMGATRFFPKPLAVKNSWLLSRNHAPSKSSDRGKSNTDIEVTRCMKSRILNEVCGGPTRSSAFSSPSREYGALITMAFFVQSRLFMGGHNSPLQ